MSLTSRIQDQKDHITQVKKMIKYPPKEKYANRHNKKIPIYFLKQIGIKNLTHKSLRLRFSFDYAEKSILNLKKHLPKPIRL
jgi:hypothetical protein